MITNGRLGINGKFKKFILNKLDGLYNVSFLECGKLNFNIGKVLIQKIFCISFPSWHILNGYLEGLYIKIFIWGGCYGYSPYFETISDWNLLELHFFRMGTSYVGGIIGFIYFCNMIKVTYFRVEIMVTIVMGMVEQVDIAMKGLMMVSMITQDGVFMKNKVGTRVVNNYYLNYV